MLARTLRPSILALSLALVTIACERTPSTVDPEPETSSSAAAGSGKLAVAPVPDDEHTLPYGERTIYVYADPSLELEVARLFALFEDLRTEAVPLDQGTRLPIGWTTLSFAVEGEHGERLIVEEPDYENQPETRTRRDISVSLATLARQRGVLERAGVAGEAIDFDQHVLTIRGVLDQPEVMLLRVDSPGGRMTGWRVVPSAGIAEQDEVDSIPVHAILAARPALLDAMLLPPGYVAFFSGDQLTSIVNERDEVVWDWTLAGPELEREPPRADTEPLLEPLD